MGVLRYILYEQASGFAIFEKIKSDEIAFTMDVVQNSIQQMARFSKICQLKAFLPFSSAENALENINAISEGEVTEYLANFLEMNLAKAKKKGKGLLGIQDPKIANHVNEKLGIKCISGELVHEICRGIRLHFDKFIRGLKKEDIAQAQLGLGHSYSRCKVKFNVHRVDNMIVQSIALLDQLDKDLNTFSMRVREWYGWHFPELYQVVKDNYLYCQVAKYIGDKVTLNESKLPGLEELVDDPEVAKAVLEAARMSMGTDISAIDMINVEHFADRVSALHRYRAKLYSYLSDKMEACAPNLAALIGEQIGARLICHAGSLTNLAKYPASTIQILGAEKALFRALKTKGNTPKYGLIFHSTFIGRAKQLNKGRIARYLANKCALACRIDCFHDWSKEVGGKPNNMFGKVLRDQVEERMEFYASGKQPRKNIEVMQGVIAAEEKRLAAEKAAGGGDTDTKEKKKKKKKKKEKEEVAADTEEPKKSKKKSKKKRKAEEASAEAEEPKKKKKKSKKKSKKKE